jgi:hypothetical protein
LLETASKPAEDNDLAPLFTEENSMKPWLKNYPTGIAQEINLNEYSNAMDVF